MGVCGPNLLEIVDFSLTGLPRNGTLARLVHKYDRLSGKYDMSLDFV
jgi:hypothetical protein